VVAIVTPNHMHFAPAKAFLDAGIHVICDKPLTGSLDEARALEKLAAASGLVFVVTHNYTAYPMIRQAREMVASGALGTLRLVHAEYLQDWLTEPVETTGQKQASWRTDPARSGAGGATGDIGTHAYNLARFVTGLRLEALSADLGTFVEGRRLDDNAHVLMRFEGGAKGTLWASQIAPGNENTLTLKVYGDKGGLEWRQEEPNVLWFTPFGEPKRLITRGGAGAGGAAAAVTRVPAGHPEGYLEGFATLYRVAARLIRARQANAAGAGTAGGGADSGADGRGGDGGTAAGGPGGSPEDALLPTVHDGAEAVAFVEACVRSSRNNGEWLPL
jgi:predicted dehydrogenase